MKGSPAAFKHCDAKSVFADVGSLACFRSSKGTLESDVKRMIQKLFRSLGLCIVVWCAAMASYPAKLAGQEKAKAANPDESAQVKALKEVREIYKDEYDKAKAPQEKQAFARKLLQVGIETAQTGADQFVLFRLARDLATEIGDSETAFEAVNEMDARYQIDAAEAKLSILVKCAKLARTPAQHKAIVVQAMPIIEPSVKADNFTVAEQIGQLLVAEAGKSHDKDTSTQVRDYAKGVDEASKLFANAKEALNTLKQKPNDPDASLTIGKYYCLNRGDWKRGLPLLAAGSNAALKTLAARELAPTTKTEQQVELGDAWWELADTSHGVARAHLLERCAHWYSQSLASLSGLPKAKVEKRLKEIEATPIVGGRPAAVGTTVSHSPEVHEDVGTQKGKSGKEKGINIVGTYTFTQIWGRGANNPGQKLVGMQVTFSPNGTAEAHFGSTIVTGTWQSDKNRVIFAITSRDQGTVEIVHNGGNRYSGLRRQNSGEEYTWDMTKTGD